MRCIKVACITLVLLIWSLILGLFIPVYYILGPVNVLDETILLSLTFLRLLCSQDEGNLTCNETCNKLILSYYALNHSSALIYNTTVVLDVEGFVKSSFFDWTSFRFRDSFYENMKMLSYFIDRLFSNGMLLNTLV